MKRDIMLLILLTIGAFALAALMDGCAPGSYVPPVSVSAGFFGASVTVAEPGYTVPAKVVSTAAVVTPTLMVPAGDPVAGGSVPVTTQTGATTVVPTVVAPVTAPVLAVPAK
jgi:hypothetical protein